MSRLHTILESVIGSFVKEALTPADKKKVGKWTKGSNSHTDKFFGGPDTDKKTHQRRYFDFTPESDSPARAQIENHFAKHGLKIKDYRGGLVSDKIGRDVSIGRKLKDTKADPELMRQYENDPARQNKREDDLTILISRHPHDVAGMTSKGQSWCDASCMNFRSGSNNHYLQRDLEHGTHVAYLVRPTDRGHPQQPIARVAIKRHEDGKGNFIFVPDEKVYGEAPKGFQQRVRDILDREHNDSQPSGDYQKNPEVYHDWGSPIAFNIGPDFEGKDGLKSDNYTIRAKTIKSRGQAHHIDAAFDNGEHPDVLIAALQNKNHRTRHVEKALASPYPAVRAAGAASIWAMPEQLEKAFDSDSSDKVKHAVLTNPSARRSLLHKGLNTTEADFTSNVDFAETVLKNPSSDESHVEAVLKNFSAGSDTFKAALRHRKMNKPHLFDLAIQQILDTSRHRGEQVDAYSALSWNKNLPANHISTIMQFEPNSDYQKLETQRAFRNLTKGKNFNDDHADQFLNSAIIGNYDKSNFAAQYRLQPHHVEHAVQNNLIGVTSNPHVKLNDEQIDTLINKNWISSVHRKKDSNIEKIAGITNLSNNHKKQLMSHSNPHVRKALWKRRDLTREDFQNGMSHSSYKTRKAAITHKDFPEDMISDVLTNSQFQDTELNSHLVSNHPRFNSDHVTSLIKHVEETGKNKNLLNLIPERLITQEHIRSSFNANNWALSNLINGRGIQWDDETLDMAVSHPNDNVRMTATWRPNLKKSHIEKLSNDPNTQVRWELANKAYKNKELQLKFLKDSSPRIKVFAAKNLSEDPNDGEAHFDNFLNDPENHKELGQDDIGNRITLASQFLTDYYHDTPRITKVFSGPHDYLKRHLITRRTITSDIKPEHIDSVFNGNNEELQNSAFQHRRSLLSDDHLKRIAEKGSGDHATKAKMEIEDRAKRKSKLQESKIPKVATFDPIEESIKMFVRERR